MASKPVAQPPQGAQEGEPPRVIRFRSSLRNTVLDVMRHRGWKETDAEVDWEIFWAEREWIHQCFDHVRLNDVQRVNHFRNHYELTRKDLLIKNLKRMKKQLEREERALEASKFDFFPGTYVLPQEFGMWKEEFKQRQGVTWIMKPIAKSQGKGIFLVNKLSQVTDWKRDHPDPSDSYIIQRYLDNPYLIGGKKFDLRIYCLVTSYSPLTAYLYRSGFGRFSFHRFTMNSRDMGNSYVHLTNVAIQKTAPDYDPNAGCKWDLHHLKMYMISKHGEGPVNELFANIQALIIRSLLAVQKVIINDKHCFELYGYDILIDDHLKPWLLEVNASPSLTADTWMDYELKFALLTDVFDVLDIEGDETKIGGFDLIYRGAPVLHPPTCSATLLGAHNPVARSPPHVIPARYFAHAHGGHAGPP
ncbi:putative tubulin tyrosine ligase [Paratrimastix pyriformis]|uniref:Tubulin--tyrosine ligase-like protein 9 n=1 Tax=Paratrimastix pyriformis TaxID=342808 RepID=A0ABQ8ULC6_9EUKA|nr:putative tubulin tyrosine ligase [Paratrimastix pyriformis]